tara:strand:+ start:2733 stop:3176 length:444 start_codon:yes stop_codon:yes gene_type:complete
MFRFAPTHPDPNRHVSKEGWNRVTVSPTTPFGFFEKTTGTMYLKTMDAEMCTARLEANGLGTFADFKMAFYRAERTFRTWLVDQPNNAFFDFLHDLNNYDERVMVCVMRYSAMPTVTKPIRSRKNDTRGRKVAFRGKLVAGGRDRAR